MSKVYGFDWDHSLGTKAKVMDAMAEGLVSSIIDSEDGQRVGLSREGLKNIKAFNHAQRHDEPPTMDRGVSAPARVNNQDGFVLEGSHVNAHGDRMIEAIRPVGGGRFERVRIRESPAGERTKIVSEFLGGR